MKIWLLDFFGATLILASTIVSAGEGASQCLSIKNSRITNNCPYRVSYVFCVMHPRQTSNFFDGSDAFDCQKGRGGMDTVGGNSFDGMVLHGEVDMFGCRSPADPHNTKWTEGIGYRGNCE